MTVGLAIGDNTQRYPRIVPGPIEIAPSVLPADFPELGDEVAALEAPGRPHPVGRDGRPVRAEPHVRPDVIAAGPPAHLAAVRGPSHGVDAGRMAAEYVQAGCQRLIVHAEACTTCTARSATSRRSAPPPRVALNPATPATAVAHVLDLVDMVLVMTVNPARPNSTSKYARITLDVGPLDALRSASPQLRSVAQIFTF